MKSVLFQRLAFLASLLAVPLFAGTSLEEADQALGEIQKSLPASTPTSSEPNSAAANLRNSVAVIRGSLAREEYAEAERMLAGVRASVSGDPKLLALVDQVTVSLKKTIEEREASHTKILETISEKVRLKITARAPAKEFDPLLAELARIPPVRSMRYQENGAAQQLEALRTFISRWQDYLNNLSLGNAEQASNALNELSSLATRTAIVPRSELLALQQTVVDARAASSSAIAARITELIRRLQTLISANAKPADIDPILEEISRIKLDMETQRQGGYSQENNNRIELLRRFATRWQDYLVQSEAGSRSAQETLRSFANESQFEAFYPRSKILALIYKSEPTADVALSQSAPPTSALPPVETLTLATLDSFSKQLSQRTRNGMNSEQSALLNSVNNLQQIASQIQSGNAQSALSMTRIRSDDLLSPAYRDALASIRTELIAQAIKLSLSPPDNLVMGKSEPAQTYVTRVLKAANEKRDWPLAQRAIETLGYLGVYADATAYRLFSAAQNFERAGQFPIAVQSYLAVLRTGSQNIPLEEISARLKAIKEQHPKEFEQGEKLPTATQQVIETRAIDPNARPYMPMPPGMPR